MLDSIFKSLDEIKYKIERCLFGNKSIHFLKDLCIHAVYSGGSTAYDEWGGTWTEESKSFLLIVNDEYLRRSTISYSLEEFQDVLTNDGLKASLLSQMLQKFIEENYKINKLSNINVINLNVDILNVTKISGLPNEYRIQEIHPNAFNGSTRNEIL
jgi:hypothetical protein